VSDEYESWHVKIFEAGEADVERANLQAFSLRTATEKQVEAIRTMARQSGFEDLRGFWKWMQAADLTYYDLIKIASPE
jgi:hypothetical protein